MTFKSREASQSARFIFKRRQTRSAEADDGAYFNPILCLESIKSNSYRYHLANSLDYIDKMFHEMLYLFLTEILKNC